jgi:hypothetical protein
MNIRINFADLKLIFNYNEFPSFIFDFLDFIPFIQNIFYCYAWSKTDEEDWKHLKFFQQFFKSHCNIDDIFPFLFKKRAKLLILIRHTLFILRIYWRHVSVFDLSFSDLIHAMKEVLLVQDFPARHLANMHIPFE